MKWDGQTLYEDVKRALYSFFKDAISEAQTSRNAEFASLLKKKYKDSCARSMRVGDGVFIYASDEVRIEIYKDVPELDSDRNITLSWSMAARHIRAWEFEKQQENPDAPTKSKSQIQWEETHLCGSFYGKHCEFLVEANDKNTVINGKKLDIYCPYCTSENKVRKLGTAGTWTGLSPKFCPKRKTIEEDTKMARKMQFDTAIIKDMQSAASDSFMDNIKMIDVSEINPSSANFYEMSGIELLADDIEREGLKHNLVVSKNTEGAGYWLKSGHRRLAAIKLLIEQKRRTSTKIPCYVDGAKSQAESKLDLIMLNATQRKYTDAEMLQEVEELKKIFSELESAGKPIKGKMRDNIAAVLQVSTSQVQKINNIKNNAVPEIANAVKSGEMSISTANEVAKLAPEKQKQIAKEKPKISHKDVKKMQEKKGVTNNTDESKSAEKGVTNNTEKSENKISLFLSENEVNTLMKFIVKNKEFDDDSESCIEEILDKLKALCGK